ncbi:MAG: GntR family transcriptional regulator [Acidobacteria bacterium]|nr:GntR family transcriptional regulator [Acidobacteriota bacterium]
MRETTARLLADKIYEQLKIDIITCKYHPGDSLTEIELANKFNVSRTPIREVCNRLMKEDFLQSIPYKGYIVSPVKLQDLHELYQIRSVLEPYAAELAARNATPSLIKHLRNILKAAVKNNVNDRPLDKQGFLRFIEADLDFHNALAEASGNARLAKIISDLRNQIERLVYLIYEHYGPYKHTGFEEHEAVVKAIETGDPKLARELMTQHINNYRNRALEALSSERLM